MERAARLAKICGWLGLIVLSIFAREVFPCSTFVLRQGNHIVFGRNYDWNIGYGLVFTNQSGLRKTTLNPQPASPSWNVKYGSITFNQYGKEAPMDGMNLSGLVIAQMWLEGTRYPAADSRPALSVLTWIQYQLDNCATVEEVLRTDSSVRISTSSSPLHFLVADRTGDAAVIEFLSERMVVHRADSLPFQVLTNSTYDESLANLRQYVGFGGTYPIPSSSGSLSRFVRIADRIVRYNAQDPTPIVDYAFATLSSVAQTSTQWTIVYDITERKVYFRTKQSGEIKSVQAGGLDFLCRTTSKLLDINIAAGGDVTALFQLYTRAANRDLIYRAYRETDFLRDTPDSVIDAWAALPDSFVCCRPKPWMDKTRTAPPLQEWKKK
jgi:penicillin V acylase-like amidase (Ntn superfamily)